MISYSTGEFCSFIKKSMGLIFILVYLAFLYFFVFSYPSFL